MFLNYLLKYGQIHVKLYIVMLSRCAANKDDSFHQDEILFNFVSKDFNFIILLSLNRRDVLKNFPDYRL